MKYNIPLMNGVQFSILGFIVFGFGIVFHFVHLLLIPNMKDGLSNDDIIMQSSFEFRRLYLESIFNFVLPIMYLATKKDLRRFLKILIDNIFQSTVKPCFLLTLGPRKIVPQVSESAN